MGALRERMVRELQLREFSASTQKLYLTTLTDLARYHHRAPDTLDGTQVQDYLLYLTRERHLAWSSVSVAASAIRFFYTQTVKRPEIAMAIPPRRKPRRLPHILSVEEVGRLLSDLRHPTHRALGCLRRLPPRRRTEDALRYVNSRAAGGRRPLNEECFIRRASDGG